MNEWITPSERYVWDTYLSEGVPICKSKVQVRRLSELRWRTKHWMEIKVKYNKNAKKLGVCSCLENWALKINWREQLKDQVKRNSKKRDERTVILYFMKVLCPHSFFFLAHPSPILRNYLLVVELLYYFFF